jgi:hypothetical protein
MSVRIIILLLALPLFLLLAAVNSLLLYREDTANMEAGLRNQALAAAVTVAEFVSNSPDPIAYLAEPRRLAALSRVNKEIAGLDALYMTSPARPPLNLLASPIPDMRRDVPPDKAYVLNTRVAAGGRHLITALAPVGRSMVVVADIDAGPLARRAFQLKRNSILLIAASAILAMLIGLILAHRVIGEFYRTRAIIDSRGDHARDRPLRIREVRDLADAVRLIDASVASELERLGKSREGDPAIGIAAARARHFPDISIDHRGVALSIRLLPNAPAGAFYACKAVENGVLFAVGEVAGEPAAAFASAVALRAYLVAGPADEFIERLSFAARVFGTTKADFRELHAGSGGFISLCLNGNGGAMRDYAAHNPELDPDGLTTDLAALFPDAGIILVARERTEEATG